MSMQVNSTPRQINSDASVSDLVSFLESQQSILQLHDAQLYYDFPLYKDYDDTVVISKVMIASPVHGVIAVGTSNVTRSQEAKKNLMEVEEETARVFDILYSRLVRNSQLKKSRTNLKFDASLVLYSPFVDHLHDNRLTEIESEICFSQKQFASFLANHEMPSPIDETTFAELIATIEGAKGLIRPKPRQELEETKVKGSIVRNLEAEIASFDRRQKHGYMTTLSGIERIRGLAGSGKTVVLAMKAAQMHLRNPEARILYTFSTKSLYQHIQRIITRFYRQFDDRDPNWNYLNIMHGWGGYTAEGVYYNSCLRHDHTPLNFSQARAKSSKPFDYACRELLSSVNIQPVYDYVFVDEGQDFPSSFLNLCVQLAKDDSLVYAYDELQTIHQTRAVSPAEFAPNTDLAEDIVLYKCYRNPREILVCAHALGFGLYSNRIVQMLENKEHWEDVGYSVIEGDFIEGSHTVILRPEENSLDNVSKVQNPTEMVKCHVHNNFEEEVTDITKRIMADIEDGLLPEDIVVIVADDRNARAYLKNIASLLNNYGIKTNNIHEDNLGLRDFQFDECVTLSTIHKAKGNEGYMVYICGVDALFTAPKVRERNMIFTAMTRAKGWVRISGIGESAEICKSEVNAALANFPNLVFEYPSEEQLKIMKRDLADSAIEKQAAERQLDEVLKNMTPEEIKRHVDQRSIQKGK